MAGRNPKHFERDLRKRFAAFVSSRGSPLSAVFETMRFLRSRGWTAFVFGGIPRGVIDSGSRLIPRDLDLVFDDEHFHYFESAFEHHILRRNNYGGLRLQFKDLQIDAWSLSSTWAFRQGHVREVSFENLPHTAFLNVDGIIVEAVPPRFQQRRIFEAGFFAGWQKRILDINLRENPYPGICFARTLHISRRFGFRLSHRLAMYLWEVLNTNSLAALEAAQVKHYGQVEFNADTMRDLGGKLEKHLAMHALFPVKLFPCVTDQLEFPLSSVRAYIAGEEQTRSFTGPCLPRLQVEHAIC